MRDGYMADRLTCPGPLFIQEYGRNEYGGLPVKNVRLRVAVTLPIWTAAQPFLPVEEMPSQ